MPTENRSSSNHGTRTFTLDSLTAALEQVQAFHEISADLIAENIFSQPAQQGQGEPVALAIPDECPHIIVFDDADRANEHFCGAGARPAALRRYEQISQSWNAHLFVRIARNSRDDRYPSATVTDPAEVERLRAELSQCEAMALMVAEREWAEHVGRGQVSGKVEEAFTQLHNDLHEAQENLAEAHALLARILGKRDPCPASYWFEEIEKVLSASAEPSAPVELCSTCNGYGKYQDGDRGTDEDGRRQNIVECDCDDSERVPQYRTRAPVEIDERASLKLVDILACELECWPDGCDEVFQTSSGRVIGVRHGDDLFSRKVGTFSLNSEGIDPRVSRDQWEQARAALERKPVEPLPPVDGDLLPPIGSKVLIHLGREDKWAEHTVVGYYAWGNHGLDQNVYRVFVRVRDAEGYLNARLLKDVRPVALERKP